MTKAHLRKQMRERRRWLQPSERHDLAQHWCQRLAGQSTFIQATSFAAYWPLADELDTRPLLRLAHAQGKAVYLPVVCGSRMWFSRWSGTPPSRNRVSRIPQPRKSAERLANRRFLDFVIVPLLAFDRSGLRLGQGGGHYDRYFQQQCVHQWHKPLLIGAAYDFQEVSCIPADSWDVRLGQIITNDEFIVATTMQRTMQ